MGGSQRLMQRISKINPDKVFFTDFTACHTYSNGEQAAAKVHCPTLFVLGAVDQMTPPKAAKGLIALAQKGKVVMLPGGHHQMLETPEPMLKALLEFLEP